MCTLLPFAKFRQLSYSHRCHLLDHWIIGPTFECALMWSQQNARSPFAVHVHLGKVQEFCQHWAVVTPLHKRKATHTHTKPQLDIYASFAYVHVYVAKFIWRLLPRSASHMNGMSKIDHAIKENYQFEAYWIPTINNNTVMSVSYT